jgi:sporulation protein YlmC with PRC-barrel domain
MNEATEQFTIGAEASCADGDCGEVTRVVVDPIAQAVTHLVVEPKHRSGLGRLVPLDIAEEADGDVRLRCTRAEFDKLDRAEETEFLPGTGGYGGYGPGQTVAWPYYGLGGGVLGGGMMGGGTGMRVGNVTVPVVYDTIPLGEVAVRRGDRVHATDGDIGKVQGLVIDASNHHVTHVLLQEGHLWGRKEVAIPISAVSGVSDGGISLTMNQQEVQDLPAADVEHLGG